MAKVSVDLSTAAQRTRVVTAAGLVLLVGTGTCAGREKAPVPKVISRLKTGRPVTIACLGDSVTGVYYHTGGRQAYPEMLAAALRSTFPSANLEVINSGVSGHASSDGIASLRASILPRRPNLVTIMFGLNDMVSVTAPQFESTLALMADECRDAGAEVILCTPNAVDDTPSRPRSKLLEYVAAVRSLGRRKGLPIADVYAAYENLRRCNSTEFSLLMSDPFHPNADGHELIARVICDTMGVEDVARLDARPSFSPLQHTRGLLGENRVIHLLATPPYDDLMVHAIRRVHPSAAIKVTPWNIAGKSLADIAVDARRVRELRPDLVVVALPAADGAGSGAKSARSYAEILNWSLSFGRREWDVLALPPSICERRLSSQQQVQDALAMRLIHAQDLPLIVRKPGDERSTSELLNEWLRQHLGDYNQHKRPR